MSSTNYKAQLDDEKQVEIFEDTKSGSKFTTTKQYSNIQFTDNDSLPQVEIVSKEPKELSPKDWDTYYKKMGLVCS